MENRKYVKFLVLIFASGLFVFQNNTAFAYSVNTHAYLTSEAVKFYNQNSSNNKISSELNDYLIDGSRREDDVPRWMNHFYDPVNNRGLTNSVLGNWQKSEDWAKDSNNQNSLLYKVPATIASILTAIQQGSVSALTTETDFNWNRAIKYYVLGDKEKAVFLLGHILHLIEDTSVPEHTRNDAHGLSSPYEIYTGQFSIYNPDNKLSQRLLNKGPIISGNLDSYFDELAKYSNNNFYSAGTIGIQSGYNLPQPDYDTKIGKYLYPTKIDKETGDYYLFRKSIPDILLSSQFDATLEPDIVLADYWSRLSVKSIQYGAGVINLFFQEAEVAKNDPNFNKVEEKSAVAKAFEAVGNFAAQVGSAASGVISSANNFLSGIFSNNQDFQQVGQVDLAQNEDKNIDSPIINQQAAPALNNIKQLPRPLEADQQLAAQDEPVNDEVVVPEEEKQQIEEQNLQLENQVQKTALVTAVQNCSFNTSQNPSRKKVIINEVAWMGTAASANDEWIELKNISDGNIDISNWQLTDKDEQIKINLAMLEHSKIIEPGGFILFERTDDSSVPNIKADLIYSGALSNSNEGLRLFDGNCSLMDEALTGSDWPAGNSAEKKTMERDAAGFGWHTSGVAGGTPKAENSTASAPIQTQSQTVYSGGGQMPQKSEITKILINEVQISPAGDRFIELYNPNNYSVNLTNWYIQRKTQTGSSFSSLVSKMYFENKIIQAKGYLLISRSAAADIVLDSLTLTGANTIQIKNLDGDVVDKVGWGGASECEDSCALEPAGNQSIKRKVQNGEILDTDNNANDFEIKNNPISQSDRAPSALFDYSPKSPQAGEMINFDASSSTDPIGQITTYQWDFGDGGTLISANPTGSHAYSRFGNYEVSLIVFNSTGASSTPAAANIPVSISGADHVVISEIMAGADNSANEEFIELYNPTEQDVSLSGWSLKRKISSESTSTVNLVREFPESSMIAAKGFFLVAHENYSNYSTSTPADIIYSNNSNPLAYSDDTVIIYNDAGGPVDEVYYQSIDKGKSLERKAWVDNACALLSQSNEFLGNACDSNSDNDFGIREIPNPQNSLSLPEPRTAPAKPENFSIRYSQNEMKANFSWDGSGDYSGNSADIIYKIFDASTTAQVAESTSTAAQISINEVGKSYQFSIQAFDKDGLGSDEATSTINIPSFLSGLYIYQNPKNTDENLIEARYENYPFVPDEFGKGDTWKIMVFYLNSGAQSDISNPSWEPNDLADVLEIKYDRCAGGTGGNSLILPDNSRHCGTDGGAYSAAFDFSDLGSNNFIVKTAKSNQEMNLGESDFITAAFYSVSSIPTMDGTNPAFQLVATDNTRHYFGAEPVRQKPVLAGEISYDFNKVSSKLNLSWQKATDPDTLDELLTYEIKYNDSEEWQAVSWENNISKFVLPGDSFSISVRAKDDFDNYSTSILSSAWSYPPIDFSIEQSGASDWSPFGNASLAFSCFGVGLQNIKSANDISFDTAVLKIKRVGGDNIDADLKLSVFGDNKDKPDFGNLIANSTIAGFSSDLAGRDVAFGFSSPVVLTAGLKYWLGLEASHNGMRDWTANYWKNALDYNTAFGDGEAGSICAGLSMVYENTFSVNSSADWYMKLGLQK